ncbi:MAG: polysaccharide deacetylase family protein [Muribaculum sp.]|nr:polysaccharide deacetylase family protein [Muribaculum sp.]
MNILTFDIEEWVIEKEHHGGLTARYAEFDRVLDRILEILDANALSATFFCLGKLALDFPYVVKKIADLGHEIGCHSHSHKWVNKMTPEEFREDTVDAVSALEDLIGRKVESFRAPAFSIDETSKWAFEILAECGIKNDASIFPGVRDFGGFPSFNEQKPCRIEYNGCVLNEFPIPLYRIPVIGKDLAYSGGGYFRLLPLWFVKSRLSANDYNMCYFHIGDLLTEKAKMMSRTAYEEYFKEPGSLKNRLMRYAKSNVGRGHALQNLEALLEAFPFTSIREARKSHPDPPVAPPHPSAQGRVAEAARWTMKNLKL